VEEQLIYRVATLEKQLEDTKRDAREQLAAKDEQIRELIQVAKKPRTVNHTTNNNRYVVEQHVNVFGNESVEHIRPEQIEAILADPANAVSRYIKLKHQKAPGGVNANVRVPNQKRAIYQVVVAGGGEDKEWENRAKGEVLEQLYDENCGHLEAEADEETRVGSQFLEHQDLVKASAAANALDGGRRYKEQLDKIHMVVAN
jgi:sugar-specific transcriptional regulator TrmB